MTLSLKALMVPSKVAEVEFPGMEGFKLQVAFLSREVLAGIRKKAVRTVIKNRQPIEELDDKLFMKLYTNAVLKDWTGLKLSYLEQLIPIDLADNDPDDEFPYSQEEAIQLMQASSTFETYVTEVVNDLGNFSKPSEKK